MRYVKFVDPADPANGDFTPVEHIVSEEEAISIMHEAAKQSGRPNLYDNKDETAFLDFVSVNWGEIIYDDEERRF
jgi:hypothetical protein